MKNVRFQQPNDVISREYLSASCAACLVGHVSFAPFCFMFIDEKLNDEECSEEENHDIFNLLVDLFGSHKRFQIF